eukprot:jgi/Mesen1/2321/ME000155S01411
MHKAHEPVAGPSSKNVYSSHILRTMKSSVFSYLLLFSACSAVQGGRIFTSEVHLAGIARPLTVHREDLGVALARRQLAVEVDEAPPLPSTAAFPKPLGREEKDPIVRGQNEGKMQGERSIASKPEQGPPTYRGGEVMSQPCQVYLVWYGNWQQPGLATATSQAILRNFTKSLGLAPPPPTNSSSSSSSSSSSPVPPPGPSVAAWYAIAAQYFDASGRHVSASIRLAGEASDAEYSRGSRDLKDEDFEAIITRLVGRGALPTNPDGVYAMLTSPDVTVTDFCTQGCAWHSSFRPGGAAAARSLKWLFVGSPVSQCPGGCANQFLGAHVPPNGDLGADAMVSALAHELVEVVTDPEGATWHNENGYENADICAWRYGAVAVAPSGGHYNLMNTEGQRFLVQENYDLLTSSCRMQSSALPPPAPFLSAAPAPSSNGPPHVGTYFALYTKKNYRGVKTAREAPVPAAECVAVPVESRPIKSICIEWNREDGRPAHVGCGRFILWDRPNCYGNGLFWELPGGWDKWDPTNFKYGTYAIPDFSVVAHKRWTRGTRSISCDTYGIASYSAPDDDSEP